MSIVAPVFAERYISAISVTVLLFDHALTLGREIDLIWSNSAAGIGSRFGFIVNRYVTEIVAVYVAYLVWDNTLTMSCHVSVWIFSMASSVVIGISHFLIIMRVYTLWDRRLIIKRVLTLAFGIEICMALIFSALAAKQTTNEFLYQFNPFIDMCAFSKKPWALKYTLGAITLFDLFIIIMTVLNALDRPHTKQADVITSLQHDGARMFACLFLFRLTSFLVAVVGNVAFPLPSRLDYSQFRTAIGFSYPIDIQLVNVLYRQLTNAASC
ncbi:hypothetical protein MVEN_01948700 [Mycena venus]|uniref:DUF6533 domain-containing protein n=1 Tax=Mycena venus TaxID=2733690 RepID=A0A8H6XGU4_9AGAR|nr:hypothetical protein MVEN_01948700 [Mycena venus]